MNITKSESGLTLLELILVMVLLGIVSIFLSDVMFYEFSMYRGLTDSTDKLQISRNSLRMMTRDIRQVMSPDSISQAYENSIRFDDVNDLTILYEFSNNEILRNGELMQNFVDEFELEYFDSSGDPIAAPVADPSQIRTIRIALATSLNNNKSINLSTQIRPRNF